MTMKTSPQISAVLRKAIQASEMNVHQLAKETGVSHPIILRFLSGERDIRLATADKLAATLGVRVSTR
jgi:transcriptional regulator with XRE-family HTH domain